jgi:glycosyltransferase involved in cell wall biosynthesis
MSKIIKITLQPNPENITNLIELFLCRQPSKSAILELSERSLLQTLRLMITGDEFLERCNKALGGDLKLIDYFTSPLDFEILNWLKQLLPHPNIIALEEANCTRLDIFKTIFTDAMQLSLLIHKLEAPRQDNFNKLIEYQTNNIFELQHFANIKQIAERAVREKNKKTNETLLYTDYGKQTVLVSHGLTAPDYYRNYGDHNFIANLYRQFQSPDSEIGINILKALYNNEDDVAIIALYERARTQGGARIMPQITLLQLGLFTTRAYMRRFMFASALPVLEWFQQHPRLEDFEISTNDAINIAKLHATCLTRIGEIEAAKQVYRKALAKFPDAYELHYNYGMMLSVDSHQLAMFSLNIASNGARKLSRQLRLSLAEYMAENGEATLYHHLLNDILLHSSNHRETYVLMQNAYLRAGDAMMAKESLNTAFARQGLAQPYADSFATPPKRSAKDKNLFEITKALLPVNYDHPKITVIMTCFNAKDTVEAAVHSILAQTFGNLELYIVDDASSDETPKILKKLAKQDARIKLIFNQTNIGTYASKNQAMAVCDGEYITFHDCDDWAHPQRLELHLTALQQDSQSQFCCSEWLRMNAAGYAIAQRHGGYIYRNPASFFMSKATQNRLGFFDSVRTGADTEYYNRAKMLFGARASLTINATLAIGLDHESSLTKSGAGRIDEYRFSQNRLDYWQAFGAWQLALEKAGKFETFKATTSKTERPFQAPIDIL